MEKFLTHWPHGSSRQDFALSIYGKVCIVSKAAEAEGDSEMAGDDKS